MEFHFFVCSFCRVGQGAKTNKRQNAKTKFHFFVCSFCRVVQVAKTKKWNFISSFLRLVALVKAPKRTNDKVTAKYQTFDLSWLLVRFVVCSFCRLPQGAKTNKRQRDKMKFCGHFVLSFVRFVALYKSPKRRNEISFWRLFVLSPSIRRQNEQTKWPYPASIQNQLEHHII